MLHIKLPKKKVAGACERVAERLSQDIARMNRSPGQGSIQIDVATALFATDRKHFHDMADMAMRSVGDVYVSPKLWADIKEVY